MVKKLLCLNAKKILGALKFTSGKSDQKNKKKLADGVIMAKIVYGISLWGNTGKKSVINKVQQAQNLAMRWITSAGRGTSVKTLLTNTGWLSVNQLTIYHSILQYWKIQKFTTPKRNMEHLEFSRNTNARIDLTSGVWSRRVLGVWSLLPRGYKTQEKISSFKKLIRKWIIENVPIEKKSDHDFIFN